MRFSYDVYPGTAPPVPGEALVRLSRRTGAPTGVWYVITAVRPVARRRPHPYDRFALEIARQQGDPPDEAWHATTYPPKTDVDAYWEARLARSEVAS